MCSLNLLILLFLTFINVYSSVLNIEELNSIHYSIDIVNNPVLKNQDWTTDIVTVTNKYGQEYICTLPEIQIPENENKKEEDLLDQLVDISELLKPMEAAPCLMKKKDWWSYEFCYGSVIKQYHLEENKVVGTILILGKYESEYNWKNNSKTKNKLQKFHIQNYVNGTRCDITGEPRRAEVRFHCEEGVGDYIQQVDEPESCRYIIIIATTRVCHHPYLKPNPNRTPHSINCAPALNQVEFDQYQKVQEIKKAKLEKERLHLLELEKKSKSDLSQNSDLTTTFGDNETDDEESKWSIRLVSIPLSKKGKNGINRIPTDEIEAISGDIDSDSSSSSSSLSLTDSESIQTEKYEGLENVKSYLTENEFLEREFTQIMKEFTEENKEKEEEEKDHDKEVTSEEKEEEEKKEVEKQFGAFKTRMEKLMGKWMEIQNEDHIHELLDKIKQNLDENVHDLEEIAGKYSEDSLTSYLNDLLEMAEKYKKNLPKVEDLNLEDEQKLVNALNSLTEILTEAELGVLKAIHKKKKLDRLEKYLESQLKKTEKGLLPLPEKEEEPSLETPEGNDSPNEENSDIISFPTYSKSLPISSPQHFEDPNDPDTGEIGSTADIEKNDEIADQSNDLTRHVKILNEKNIEDDRKLRLEQSIKERLQKSGLDNIGRKIEVKILTPNFLDDDEKDTLSNLSQEETEAFHNMIVNILSASAEEYQERERHKSLETNYNFRLEEPDILLEEMHATDPDTVGGADEGDTEAAKSKNLSDSDRNKDDDDNNNNNNNNKDDDNNHNPNKNNYDILVDHLD